LDSVRVTALDLNTNPVTKIVMWRKVGVVWLLLLTIVASVSSEDVPAPIGSSQTQALQQARVDEANRYLSAELNKQLKSMQEDMLKQVNANNDENFRQFDGRMTRFMDDMRWKVLIGGLGVMILAGALMAYFLHLTTKRYSYEAYQQKIIGMQQQELDRYKAHIGQGVEQMQQQSWEYGRPEQGLTATGVMTQEQAATQSQVNEWQYDAPYQGAWVPPEYDDGSGQQSPQEWEQNQNGVR
jgi:hypothetical protein